jgi:hypothetical protein
MNVYRRGLRNLGVTESDHQCDNKYIAPLLDAVMVIMSLHTLTRVALDRCEVDGDVTYRAIIMSSFHPHEIFAEATDAQPDHATIKAMLRYCRVEEPG